MKWKHLHYGKGHHHSDEAAAYRNGKNLDMKKTIRKWGTDLSREFSEEETRMSERHWRVNILSVSKCYSSGAAKGQLWRLEAGAPPGQLWRERYPDSLFRKPSDTWSGKGTSLKLWRSSSEGKGSCSHQGIRLYLKLGCSGGWSPCRM